MGNKCSCLNDTTTEEKVLTTERKMMSICKSPKLNIQEFKEFSDIAISESIILEFEYLEEQIIPIQSVLRGFLERKKSRKTLRNSSFQTFRKDSKKTFSHLSRTQSIDFSVFKRELKELSESEIPDYSCQTVTQLLSTLSPFIFPYKPEKGLSSKGPVLLENKAIYTGSWNNLSQRHGFGKMLWFDGSLYEGEWKYDMCNGQGRLLKCNGDFYEGSWLDDQFHGFGKYQSKNGNFYEGFWEANMRSGKGFELIKNVSMFTGSFLNDQKSGNGSVKYENGDSYEGEFFNGKMQGFGVFKWKDGRIYQGEWLEGIMHGKGDLHWKDGRHYSGGFNNGKKEGTGKFVWPDGRVYEGSWKKDKQDGAGMYITSVGVRRGIWSQGKRIHD
jgi:hypothetical protein